MLRHRVRDDLMACGPELDLHALAVLFLNVERGPAETSGRRMLLGGEAIHLRFNSARI